MTLIEKLIRIRTLGQQIHLMIQYEESWTKRIGEAAFLKKLKQTRKELRRLRQEMEN